MITCLHLKKNCQWLTPSLLTLWTRSSLLDPRVEKQSQSRRKESISASVREKNCKQRKIILIKANNKIVTSSISRTANLRLIISLKN